LTLYRDILLQKIGVNIVTLTTFIYLEFANLDYLDRKRPTPIKGMLIILYLSSVNLPNLVNM